MSEHLSITNKTLTLSELRKSKNLDFGEKELFNEEYSIPTVKIYLKSNHNEYVIIVFNKHFKRTPKGKYELIQKIPTINDDIENLPFIEIEYENNIDSLLSLLKSEFDLEFGTSNFVPVEIEETKEDITNVEENSEEAQ